MLDRMIETIRGGASSTLALVGEPGIGKTALLDYAVDVAADLTVMRAAGVESEMELAFAALHQLCAPLFDHLERIAEPQREALEIVFGLTAGPPPDRFLIGLATLSLLSEVAAQHQLLCVVDDAQWLDGASAQVLAFVARRLRAEPMGLLSATRERGSGLLGLPELEIRGLNNLDAGALLSSVVPVRLDQRVRDRIVAETRGNPLALLELPRGLSTAQLTGGFGLVGALGLTGRIEESFRHRLEGLPPDTKQLLVIAAAEPFGDPTLLWGAAERLDIDASAAVAAELAGLFTVGPRVTFRHPLVRSAVYRSASSQQRRAAHQALADVTDWQLDPDRRAWHLAAAASGPDEAVALELERSAGRAQARGGLAAAAAFLHRALALTRDPAQRTERALAAAQASLRAGAFNAALELLVTTETAVLDECQRARVDLLRGQIAFSSGLGSDAAPLLLKAAKRLEPLNLEMARETYLTAWGAAAFAGRVGAGNLLEICLAATALPPLVEPPRPQDLLLDGLARLITEGRAAAASALWGAARLFASGDVPIEVGLRWGWLATVPSFSLWDIAGAQSVCVAQLQRVRNVGALEGLPLYLAVLGVITTWSGDFATGASFIAEAEEVTAATGARVPPFAALLLFALRGREPEATALIHATLDGVADVGHGAPTSLPWWTAAVLYNGLGRYKEALGAAEQATSDPIDLYPAIWALPELIEAAARCGEVEVARSAIERLAKTTQPSGTDFGLGIEARSRALLEDGDTAEQLYREAIDRLGSTQLRPELARAYLLYGEWLRRLGRRVEAREQLRTAQDMFATIGMEAFAERARIELVATGERARRRNVETLHVLTDQERQIALLARDGLTNPEIGLRLFISPRTVEWHLRKVFSKLAITSRRQLTEALLRSETRSTR